MMAYTRPFRYPDIPKEMKYNHFSNDRQLLVVGVFGKSHHPDANKMAPFDILQYYPSLDDTLPPPRWPSDSDITFYMQPATSSAADGKSTDPLVLYMHIVSPEDTACIEHLADEMLSDPKLNILSLTGWARVQSARLLLLAVQMCHIVVLAEPTDSFDASYLAVFKALRCLRDRLVVPQLSAVLRVGDQNAQRIVDELQMGTDMRLCSPRFLFHFERAVPGFAVKQLEFDVEDKIYKLLRHEFVITNNSAASLFSIPRNKRFVFINSTTSVADGVSDDGSSDDPELDSLHMLQEFIETSSRDRRSTGALDSVGDFDDIRPHRGFAKHFKQLGGRSGRPMDAVVAEVVGAASKRSFMDLLNDHITEALENGFDDSCSKFKGKSQFLVPSVKSWFDMFDVMHNLFVVKPTQGKIAASDVTNDDFGTLSTDNFKWQLAEHLESMLNSDERFFTECGEHGIDFAVENYLDMLPTHYSRSVHQRKIHLAYDHLQRFARMPATAEQLRDRLTAACDVIWMNGCQQCEHVSLRGNPCAKPLHTVVDHNDHASSMVFIATCNCGRIQGRRDDPFTVRQANFEFYRQIATQCSWCSTQEQMLMPVFEPSVRDFRAAAVSLAELPKAEIDQQPPQPDAEAEEVDVSQSSVNSLFLDFTDANEVVVSNSDLSPSERICNGNGEEENDNYGVDEDEDEDNSVNEILINRQKRADVEAASDVATRNTNISEDRTSSSHADTMRMRRQPSTTEYLPGMVHTASPVGLLPLFPSWSLMYIGPSSVYSHSGGLGEHLQNGFLAGSNYLLPWDVHVRLEHATTWAASYERTRTRRKNSSAFRQAVAADGQVITLKVFIGCEYECARGHRFFMSSPSRVLRGGLAGIAKDSGNRVVFNDMPLYVACPCRGEVAGSVGNGNSGSSTSNMHLTTKPVRIAQLMRVHIVTPKAPVNVIVDPRVRVGDKDGPVFVLGMPTPPRLTQSSYWILRLPYVYQGEDGLLFPPKKLMSSVPLTRYGCLEAAMFGISEIEATV